MSNTRLRFDCPSCHKTVNVPVSFFMRQFARLGAGQTKNFSPEELQLRRERLAKVRALRWTKRPMEHDGRKTIGAQHRESDRIRERERQGLSPALPVAVPRPTAAPKPVPTVGRNEPCPCSSGL